MACRKGRGTRERGGAHPSIHKINSCEKNQCLQMLVLSTRSACFGSERCIILMRNALLLVCPCWHTACGAGRKVGHTFMPAFSARARTTDSKASANLRMAYCSNPGHVYRTRSGKNEGRKRWHSEVREGSRPCCCKCAKCLPLSNW